MKKNRPLTHLTDRELIDKIIQRARDKEFTSVEMAAEVKMSDSWARHLLSGRISTLRFRTRNRIIRVLGV